MPTSMPAAEIAKTRLVLLPLIVRQRAPGPTIDRLWAIVSGPEARTIVVGHARLNTIVPPGSALKRASRNEPPPASALLVTVTTAAMASICWLTMEELL